MVCFAVVPRLRCLAYVVACMRQLRFLGELVQVGLVEPQSLLEQLQAFASVAADTDAAWRRRRFAAFMVLSTLVWVRAANADRVAPSHSTAHEVSSMLPVWGVLGTGVQ